ncbi:hypothetical protein RclHR1_10440010 [Rhizophagus clarus]|nr:hypothetical protein RclHR1_10440010 [Rhizophagus clarus]
MVQFLKGWGFSDEEIMSLSHHKSLVGLHAYEQPKEKLQKQTNNNLVNSLFGNKMQCEENRSIYSTECELSSMFTSTLQYTKDHNISLSNDNHPLQESTNIQKNTTNTDT